MNLNTSMIEKQLDLLNFHLATMTPQKLKKFRATIQRVDDEWTQEEREKNPQLDRSPRFTHTNRAAEKILEFKVAGQSIGEDAMKTLTVISNTMRIEELRYRDSDVTYIAGVIKGLLCNQLMPLDVENNSLKHLYLAYELEFGFISETGEIL